MPGGSILGSPNFRYHMSWYGPLTWTELDQPDYYLDNDVFIVNFGEDVDVRENMCEQSELHPEVDPDGNASFVRIEGAEDAKWELVDNTACELPQPEAKDDDYSGIYEPVPEGESVTPRVVGNDLILDPNTDEPIFSSLDERDPFAYLRITDFSPSAYNATIERLEAPESITNVLELLPYNHKLEYTAPRIERCDSSVVYDDFFYNINYDFEAMQQLVADSFNARNQLIQELGEDAIEDGRIPTIQELYFGYVIGDDGRSPVGIEQVRNYFNSAGRTDSGAEVSIPVKAEQAEGNLTGNTRRCLYEVPEQRTDRDRCWVTVYRRIDTHMRVIRYDDDGNILESDSFRATRGQEEVVDGFPTGNPGCSTRVTGDPHVATMDGNRYDSFSLGEFVYLEPIPGKSPSYPITIHARQDQVDGWTDSGVLATTIFAVPEWTSWVTSVAFEAEGDVYEITMPLETYAGWGESINADLWFFRNGEKIDLPPGLHTFDDIEFQVNSPRSVRVSYGPHRINVMVAESAWLEMRVNTAQDDTHYGMLGRPNGDIADDFLWPDGTQALDGYDMSNGWRITDTNESLFRFTYGPDQGPFTYNRPQAGEPPSRQELEPYLQEAEDLLTAACQADTIDDLRIREVAIELYIGRTPGSINAVGACYYDVRGQIMNSLVDDLPVPGAQVTVTVPNGESCTTFTNRQGRYTCPVPSTGNLGTIDVLVSGRGSAQATLDITEKPPAAGYLPMEQDFDVEPTTLAISGTVRDGLTNEGLYNAELRLSGPEGAGFARIFAATDGFGDYNAYMMFDDGVTSGDIEYFITYAADWVNALDSERIRSTEIRAVSGLTENALNPVPADFDLSGVTLGFEGRAAFSYDPAIPVEGLFVVITPTQPHPDFTTPCRMTTLIEAPQDTHNSISGQDEFDPEKETKNPAEVGTYSCDVPVESVDPFEVEITLYGTDGFTIIDRVTRTITPTGVSTGNIYPVNTPLLVDTPVLVLQGTVRGPQGDPVAGARVTPGTADALNSGTYAVADANGVYTAHVPLDFTAAGGANGTVNYGVRYLSAATGTERIYAGATTGVPYTITQDFTLNQTRYTFYGRVIDAEAGDSLVGASIFISAAGHGQLCGENGVGTGYNWQRLDSYVMPPGPFQVEPPVECSATLDTAAPNPITFTYNLAYDGYTAVYTTVVDAPPLGQKRAVPFDLVIPPGNLDPTTTIVLSGTVDRPSGAPMQGATVKADILDETGSSVLDLSLWEQFLGDGDPRVSGRVDADGRYNITADVPADLISGTVDYEIIFRTLPVTATQSFTGIISGTENVITNAMTYGNRTVYLTGRLTNTYGLEMPYTDISIQSPDLYTERGNACVTQIDADGTFVCVGQTPETDFEVTLNASGFWGAYTTTLDVSVPAEQEIVEVIFPDQTVDLTVLNLRGRVTTSGGELLPDVEVTASSNDFYRVAYGETITDGTYSLYAIVQPDGEPQVEGSFNMFVGYGEAGVIRLKNFTVTATQSALITDTFDLDLRVVTFKGEILNGVVMGNELIPALIEAENYYVMDGKAHLRWPLILPEMQSVITEALISRNITYTLVPDTIFGQDNPGPMLQIDAEYEDDLIGILVSTGAWDTLAGMSTSEPQFGIYGTRVLVTSPQYGRLCEYALLDSFRERDYECSAGLFSSAPFDVDYRLSGEWGTAVFTGTVTDIPAVGERVTLERPLVVHPATVLLTGQTTERDGLPLSDVRVTMSAPQFTGRLATTVQREFEAYAGDEQAAYSQYIVVRDGADPFDISYEAAFDSTLTGEPLVIGRERRIVPQPGQLVELNTDFSFPQRKVTLSGYITNTTNPSDPLSNQLTIVSPTFDRTICQTGVTAEYECEMLVFTDTNYLVGYRLEGVWGVETLSNRTVTGTARTFAQDLAYSPREITINGRVTRPDGTPLPEADVTMTSFYLINGRRIELDTVTDENGNYTLSNLLGPGISQIFVDYTVEINGNEIADNRTFEIDPDQTIVTVNADDIVVDTSQVTFTGGLINSLMGTSGPWSKTRLDTFGQVQEDATTRVVVESPTEGYLCEVGGVVEGYECTATVDTTAPFDVEYQVYGDWGRATLTDRITDLPAFGEAGIYTRPVTVTPTMLKITGQAYLTYTEPYTGDDGIIVPRPLDGVSVNTNQTPRYSDPLISAHWSRGIETDASGAYTMYVVLREIDGTGTGTLPMVFDGQGVGSLNTGGYVSPTVSFSATEGIINEMNADFYFEIPVPEPPISETTPGRTLNFFVEHRNALVDDGLNTGDLQPKQHIIIESPVYGQLCNTAEPSLSELLNNKDPEPVAEIECSLTVYGEQPVDVVVRSFGVYTQVQRVINIPVADLPAENDEKTYSEQIMVEATTLRFSGLINDGDGIPVGDINVDVSVMQSENSVNPGERAREFGRAETVSGENGLYETYLLLPEWEEELFAGRDSVAVDLFYTLEYDEIVQETISRDRIVDLRQLNDVFEPWQFTKRRVRFYGTLTDENLPDMAIPGEVYVTSPDLFSDFYCSTSVNEETGEYSCDALLDVSDPITVAYRVNALWGSTDVELLPVTEINGVGQTTLVEKNITGSPTSMAFYGRVTDPFGAGLPEARIIVRNDNLLSFRSDITTGPSIPPAVDTFAERALVVETDEDGWFTAYSVLNQNIASGDLEFDITYGSVNYTTTFRFDGLQLNTFNDLQNSYDVEMNKRRVTFDGSFFNTYAPGIGLTGNLDIVDDAGGDLLCDLELNAGESSGYSADGSLYTGEYACSVEMPATAVSVTYRLTTPYRTQPLNLTLNVPADVVGGNYDMVRNIGLPATTLFITSTVQDAVGNPVPGAEVTLGGGELSTLVSTSAADQDGNFALKAMVPNTTTAAELGYTINAYEGDGYGNEMTVSQPFAEGALNRDQQTIYAPEIVFDKRRVRFIGYVRNALDTNEGLGDVSVTLSAPEYGDWCRTTSWSSGYYRCPQLVIEPGTEFTYTSTVVGEFGTRVLTHTIPAADFPAAATTGAVTQDVLIEPTTLKLDGLVRGPDGAALNGVSLTFTGNTDQVATTDATGRYATNLYFEDGINTADLTIALHYDQITAQRTYTNLLQTGALITDTRPFTFTERQVTLAGQMINSTNGRPVANAAVDLYEAGVGHWCETTTADDGSFTCGGRLVKGGFALTGTVDSVFGTLPLSATVPVTDVPAIGDAGFVPVTFEIAPTTLALTGQVVDDQGQPLDGATLSVSGAAVGTTDVVSGSYTLYTQFESNQSTAVLNATLTYGDLSLDRTVTATLVAGQLVTVTEPYTFTLREITFDGDVVHALRPDVTFPGVDVTLADASGPLCTGTSFGSGDYPDCTVLFTTPISGDLTLTGTVTADWGSDSRAYTIPAAELPALGQSKRVDLQLTARPTTIYLHGTVRDADNTLLNGVRVDAAGVDEATAFTGSDGGYEMYLYATDGLTTADLDLDFSYGTFDVTRTLDVPLTADQVVTRDVNVEFAERQIGFTGRITNQYVPASGVPGVDVTLSSPDLGVLCSTTTDADGDYGCADIVVWGSFTDGLPITLTMNSPWANDVQTMTVDDTDLPAIGTTGDTAVDAALAATTLRAAGTVRDADGQPLSGADLTFDGDTAGTVTTAADGSYTAALLYDQAITTSNLSIDTAYGAFTVQDVVSVTIASGQITTTTTDIEFAVRELIVAGAVENGLVSGMTLADTAVNLSTAADGAICTTTTDGNGDYDCPPLTLRGSNLQPLTVTAELSAVWGTRTLTQTIAVGDLPAIGTQDTAVVNWTVSPTTLHISGTVRQPDGTPLPATVSINGDAVTAAETADATGRYDVYVVLPTGTITTALVIDTAYNSRDLRQTDTVTVAADALTVYDNPTSFGVRALAFDGTVTNELDGTLTMADTAVTLSYADQPVCTTTTAENGTYSCDYSEVNITTVGDVTLDVTLSGTWGTTTDTLLIPAVDLPAIGNAATYNNVDFTADPSTLRFTGSVDDGGSPVENAAVTIAGPDLPTAYVTTTDAAGTYTATGYLNTTAVSGTITATVSFSGYFNETVTATYDNLPADQINPVAFSPVSLATSDSPNACNEFVDEFYNTLDAGWNWVREDDAFWSLTENENHLRITTQAGDIVGGGAQDTNNILLRDAAGQNVRIYTELTFDPTENYQSAGLMVYENDGEFLRFGPVYADGLQLEVINEVNGSATSDMIALTDTIVYLRLTKLGTGYTADYSADGVNWTTMGSYTNGMSAPQVGLFAQGATSSTPTPADFDWFCAVTTPTVIDNAPIADSVNTDDEVTAVQATFDQPLDTATLTADTVTLVEAGADGTLDTADDQPVTGTINYNGAVNQVAVDFTQPLTTGLYRAVLTPAVADVNGNPSAYTHTWSFEVRPAVTWIKDGGGQWDNPANWSSGTVPDNNDVVIIDRGGDWTITHDGGNHTVYELRSQEKLNLTGGTLTVNGTADLYDTFTLSGGTLSGGGAVTVHDSMVWTGGSLYNGGGELVIDNNATLSMEGSGSKVLHNYSMTNNGTATWSGTGDIYLQYTADLVNNGTFDVQNDEHIYNYYSGSKTFTNSGVFQKTAGTGTTEIDVWFNNNGLVDLQTGTIRFDNGGTDTGGEFRNTGDGWLRFNGSTRTIDADGLITGTRVMADGGTVNHAGTYNVSDETYLNGGNLSLSGDVTSLGELLQLESGTFTADAQMTVPAVLHTGGNLSGGGILTATDTYTWTSGSLYNGGGELVIDNNATLSMEGSGSKVLHNYSMTNNGSATWSGSGDIYLQYTADLVNNGTFDVQNDERIYSYYSGSKTFTNNGLFRKAAGTGTTEIDVWFNNNGLVDVQTGTIRFDNGGTDTGGEFRNTGDGWLRFNGSTRTIDADGLITGTRIMADGGTVNHAGTYNVSEQTRMEGGNLNLSGDVVSLGDLLHLNSGTFTADAPMTVPAVLQTGGTLSGGGVLTATDTYTWTSGSLYNGGGELVIGENATLSMEGSGSKVLHNYSIIR